MPAPLRPKQIIFINEYVIDKNATRAAIAAGYSKKTAASMGAENLRKPQIKREIEKRLAALAKKSEITAERLIAELKSLALVKLTDAFDENGKMYMPKQMPDDVQVAISSIEVYSDTVGGFKIGQTTKVKLNDKIRAIELLGKHLGLFKDNVHITQTTDESVVVHIFENGTEVKNAKDKTG